MCSKDNFQKGLPGLEYDSWQHEDDRCIRDCPAAIMDDFRRNFSIWKQAYGEKPMVCGCASN
jgi:hypothetical protein